jgi:hypothetical protein
MNKTFLTNDSGKWISQQIMEAATEPDYSYLDTLGIGLTQAQKNVLIANNRDYIYLTFGRPQSWNGASETIIITTDAHLRTINANVIYTDSIADNIVANDILTFYTQNLRPIESSGPYLVTNVLSNTIVTLNAAPAIEGLRHITIRTRNGYSDSNVPNVVPSLASSELDVWNNMLGGKLLSGADFAYVVPRYDWTANTVYAKYDHRDQDLFNKAFYVLTSEYKVYKCLDNNGNSKSTVEPSTIPSQDWRTPQTTSDGYVWKYMFSLDESDTNFTLKFLTDDYMPVKRLTAEASEPINQWDVQQAAVAGAIDNLVMTNGGSGYVIPEDGPLEIHFVGGGGEGAEGTGVVDGGEIIAITVTQSGSGYGSNATRTFTGTVNSSIIVHTGANLSNTYNGSYISGNTIPANTYITAIENGASPKRVYLSANVTANGPIGGALISGIPRISIVNGGGTGASAIAILTDDYLDDSNDAVTIVDGGEDYVSPIFIRIFGDGDDAQASVSDTKLTNEGEILAIDMDVAGSGYTNASISILGGQGTNATAIYMPGPPMGHGSNPVSELGARSIMISVGLSGDESGNLATSLDNDYRQVALLANPTIFGTTERANATSFMQTHKITVTPGLTNYVTDELVFQTTVGVDEWTYVAICESFDTVNNALYVTNVFRLQGEEVGHQPDLTLPIKGHQSNAFRNMINHDDPYLNPRSGEILFVQNMVPIVRSSDQVEYIRIVMTP